MQASNSARIVLAVLAVGVLIVLVGLFQNESSSQGPAADASSAIPVRKQEHKDPWEYLQSTEQQIQFFEDRVKDTPHDALNLTMLADAYLRKARNLGDFSSYDRADAAVQRALKSDPACLPAQIDRVLILSARHQFAEGLILAEELYRQNPQEDGLLTLIGDAHLELGHYREAEKTYQELLRKDQTATLHARQSRLAELKGNIPEALRLLELAATEEVNTRLSKEGGVWYQARLGELHLNAGHLEEAGKHFQSALKFYPRYPLALVGMGKLRVAEEKYEEAIDWYHRAMGESPELLAVAELGDLYVKIGKDFLARVIFEKVEKTARGQSAYNRDLCVYWCNHDLHLPEALKLAQEELEVRQDIYTYDVFAWALYKNQRFAEAEKASRLARQLGTRDANFCYHAGMIEYRLRQEEKARECLESALKINPHFSLLGAAEARKTLGVLRQGKPAAP